MVILGKRIVAIRITEGARQTRAGLRPMFKYVGNMHGDETVGRQVLIYLAQYLVNQYGSNPRVTRLLDTTEVYILPTMNPDGFEVHTSFLALFFPSFSVNFGIDLMAKFIY